MLLKNNCTGIRNWSQRWMNLLSWPTTIGCSVNQGKNKLLLCLDLILDLLRSYNGILKYLDMFGFFSRKFFVGSSMPCFSVDLKTGLKFSCKIADTSLVSMKYLHIFGWKIFKIRVFLWYCWLAVTVHSCFNLLVGLKNLISADVT